MEEWEDNLNYNVDTEVYLRNFLASWLNGRALSDASTSIRSEAFWMAVEMAQGKRLNLVVRHLAWAYNRLGEFKAIKGKLVRSYGPWALIAGWLWCYFSQAHSPHMAYGNVYEGYL